MTTPVIFIVVDSVRYYKTDIDDRGRLSYMDSFASYSLDYQNAIASAPSSVMSAATMFTGIESSYLARNYNDWEFDKSNFDSLQNILKNNGYSIFSIDNSRTGREVTKDLTQPLPKKFFPKGISHRNFWTNIEMLSIAKNLFTKNIPKKSFFMFWFDCRDDPNTSYCVEKTIELFKEKNFFNDSIIVLTSDHGYPDPSTGFNKNSMRNLRHDMVVTDDNIKVPLFIKTPENLKGTVNEVVGHIDLLPTILGMLNIELPSQNKIQIKGLDIVKNRNKLSKNRIIRTDTRLLLQKGRITSLRNSNYKLVIYHDTDKKELYDLKNDPNELSPTSDFKNIDTSQFLEYFDKSNNDIINYHIEYLRSRIKNLELFFIKNDNCKVLIFGKYNFTLLFEITSHFQNFENIFFYLTDDSIQLKSSNIRYISDSNLKKKFHFGLYLTEKRHFSFDDPVIFNRYSKICKKVICADYNLFFYNRFIVRWLNPLIKYRRNFYFYKEEPILIFYDILRIIKNFYLTYIKNEKTLNPDMQELKLLRDRAVKASKENLKI